ncbi:MAG: hypothetical protein J5685_04450 [Clostridiales bacterium]|nr:hypothetical protein [Clostridiales bacterium]
MLLICICTTLMPSCSIRNGYDYSWTSNKYIAHAFGAANNWAYTNSREALQRNYAEGYKVFEADLIETTDGDLVCWHGWTTAQVDELIPEEYRNIQLSTEEFNSLEIEGNLHTMTFDYVVSFMSLHKDIYLVTDTKSPNTELTMSRFQKIYETCKRIDPSVLDRIIPQIYYNGMLDEINTFYNWKSIIYTTYLLPRGTMYSDFIGFAAEHGIKVIAAYPDLLNDDFLAYVESSGLQIYVFTVNSYEEVEEWDSKGIDGYYTDVLL